MKPENLKCPMCKGPMVPRTNRTNGTKFWGCLAYPSCKGSRDVEGRSFDERREERDDENREIIDDCPED